MWKIAEPNTFKGTAKKDAGLLIRLGGRVGTIYDASDRLIWVKWEGVDEKIGLEPSAFPLLEIWVEEPTISKEAAEELSKWFYSCSCFSKDERMIFVHKLDSMIKKD